MSEAEWVAFEDPRRMLAFLRGKASGRKLRHLMVACVFRILRALDDPAAGRVLQAIDRCGLIVLCHEIPDPDAAPSTIMLTDRWDLKDLQQVLLMPTKQPGRFMGEADYSLDTAAQDRRPWEQPGAVRRDCAPHRGAVLWALSIASLVCGLLSLALWLPALLGLVLGIFTTILAERDQTRMRAGLMDPGGRELAERARRYCEAGMLFSFFGLILCGPIVWLPHPCRLLPC